MTKTHNKLSRIMSYGHPGGGASINGERRRKKDFRKWLRKKEKRELLQDGGTTVNHKP